ncbi:hypothetical protein [Flavobacterium sp.]|uniref:hypothetical protein n=1 Tax=Flavobacterium sp. TaxID=239 RepID=UPI00286D6F19|nr:hypothetical protein [Flavobacterium sp.]
MKKAHYTLFVLLGLIPATFLIFMILVSGIFGFALSGKIIYLVQMLLGISGYLGFLLLLRGLKEQYYKLNLILLGLGLFGFNMFLFFDEEMAGVWKRMLSGKRNLDEWLLVFLLPNIVSLIFVIFISIKMYNIKNEK